MTLQDSVAAWHESAVRVVALLRTLPPDAWMRDTDCPGWTVHDVAAHLAAIESELAQGERLATVADGSTLPSDYTQLGVDARAHLAPAQIIEELEQVVATRSDQLRDLDKVEPHTRPPHTPADVAWSWDRLLSNRAVDLWVHEQDIRSAADVPGGMHGQAVAHTVTVFRSALPYVLGKRVGAPAGTAARWIVTGEHGFDVTVAIGDDGRAREVEPREVSATIHLTDWAFTRLAAGRRPADALDIRVEGDSTGDTALAQRILDMMPVTR